MGVVFWIIVAVIGAYYFWQHTARRGMTFARAAIYLQMLDDGETVENANQEVNSMFSKHDTSDWGPMVAIAKSYSQAHFGGKQLPVIATARAKGFREDTTEDIGLNDLIGNNVVDELLSRASKFIDNKTPEDPNINQEQSFSGAIDQHNLNSLDKRWFLIPAGLLLIGILPFPYGYYQVLRIVVTIASGIICYTSLNSNERGWAITFGLVCLLFNPFTPIHLNKGLWVLSNIIIATIFFVAWKAASAQNEDSPNNGP